LKIASSCNLGCNGQHLSTNNLLANESPRHTERDGTIRYAASALP
jgi:hypothetical protein